MEIDSENKDRKLRSLVETRLRPQACDTGKREINQNGGSYGHRQ